MENNNQPSEKEPSLSDKILDKLLSIFKWWNGLATLNADDPILLGFFKIFIRLVGIIILIIMSPFVLLALFVAFTAVF